MQKCIHRGTERLGNQHEREQGRPHARQVAKRERIARIVRKVLSAPPLGNATCADPFMIQFGTDWINSGEFIGNR